MPFIKHHEKSPHVECYVWSRVYVLTEEAWTILNEAMDSQLYRKLFVEVESVYGHKLRIKCDQIITYVLISPDGVLLQAEEDEEEQTYRNINGGD